MSPWGDKQADGSSMASAFQGFRRRLLKLNSSHGLVGVLPASVAGTDWLSKETQTLQLNEMSGEHSQVYRRCAKA